MNIRISAAMVAALAMATPGFAQRGVATPASVLMKPPNDELPNPYKTLRDWAELPKGMTWPAITGVLEGSDGRLYVLGRCHENSCAGRTEPSVLIYDQNGKLLNSWGAGMFQFPHGFWMDKDDNVYITDAQTDGTKGNQAFKFSKDGKLLLTIGKGGKPVDANDSFDQPASILVAPNGDIFVGEGHSPTYGQSRIVKFDNDGQFIQVIMKKGRMPGELMGPHNMAIDSQGRIFIADRGNNRIVIMDQEGKYLDEWRQFGLPAACLSPRTTRCMWPTRNPGARMNPAGKKASASAAPRPAW